MEILKFSLGQLQANCYFLIQDNECLIIDPADEASFILEELQRRKLKLVGMLATHGHFDHIMAAGEIQVSLRETSRRDVSTLNLNRNDLFLIDRLSDTAKYFLGYDPQVLATKNIKYLKEGIFHVSHSAFHVILTPGHTPGSSCFYFKKEKMIFTGDTLFKQGIGRYDFSYSNKKDLRKSLDKLLKLPEDTIIYPGHGENSKILDERKAATLIY